MERVCFISHVKQEKLDEYKRLHSKVWPKMLEAIHISGWRNYSLFLGDDGLLVGYFETENFHRALEALTRQEVNHLWQREMAPFFVNLSSGRPDASILRLSEILHTK